MFSDLSMLSEEHVGLPDQSVLYTGWLTGLCSDYHYVL